MCASSRARAEPTAAAVRLPDPGDRVPEYSPARAKSVAGAGYRPSVHVERFESAESQIDLVISDVVMPGASGPALLKYLWERHPSLKILFMSGYADDAVPTLGRLDKGTVFLQKPFTSERLITKVQEALER